MVRKKGGDGGDTLYPKKKGREGFSFSQKMEAHEKKKLKGHLVSPDRPGKKREKKKGAVTSVFSGEENKLILCERKRHFSWGRKKGRRKGGEAFQHRKGEKEASIQRGKGKGTLSLRRKKKKKSETRNLCKGGGRKKKNGGMGKKGRKEGRVGVSQKEVILPTVAATRKKREPRKGEEEGGGGRLTR